ncbi:MAG: trehalose-phosphatase, partial [Acidimicrobiia bacterium]
GDAVRDLANRGAAVLYIGDDITDETVFEVLGDADVGIKVGSGPTAAKFRVESVSDVVAILEMIDLASR